MLGSPDGTVLQRARTEGRVLLTRNCNDFQELHQDDSTHSGILAVYQDAEPAKHMSYQAILRAIANLEASGLELANQFVVLNQWSY
jgi:Domain of unknown function (DUF5615)